MNPIKSMEKKYCLEHKHYYNGVCLDCKKMPTPPNWFDYMSMDK